MHGAANLVAPCIFKLSYFIQWPIIGNILQIRIHITVEDQVGVTDRIVIEQVVQLRPLMANSFNLFPIILFSLFLLFDQFAKLIPCIDMALVKSVGHYSDRSLQKPHGS